MNVGLSLSCPAGNLTPWGQTGVVTMQLLVTHLPDTLALRAQNRHKFMGMP